MILVGGATGRTGRALVAELVSGGHQVRALTRDPDAARPLLPSEVDLRAADLDFAELLDDVHAVFLTQTAGSRTAALLAAAHDVERVVYVSSLIAGAYLDSPIGMHVRAGEQAVQDSGHPWTLLRPWEFQSNTLVWAPAIQTDGVVRLPTLGKPSPAVAAEDIAAVAARALVEDGHAGQVYRLTGPAEITPDEKVRLLSEALGRELMLVVAGEALPHEDPVVAAVHVPGVCGLDSLGVSPDVIQVTGHPARDFGWWAHQHAAEFSLS